MLRDDELFVTESLCAELSGVWREGEDPPDVYININEKDIAVEISTLTQHAVNDSGKLISRLSQDTGVVRICNEINTELSMIISENIYIILTIYAPIIKLRKFKEKLKDEILFLVKAGSFIEKTLEINKNKVKIHLIAGKHISEKKIVGIISNTNTSSNILDNVYFLIGKSIKDKTMKCSKITHRPLWLALFNDYWLANEQHYMEAINKLSINHPFEKIFLVDGGKRAHEIYSKL